eukprot:2244271-Rhodomonas_salina.1
MGGEMGTSLALDGGLLGVEAGAGGGKSVGNEAGGGMVDGAVGEDGGGGEEDGFGEVDWGAAEPVAAALGGGETEGAWDEPAEWGDADGWGAETEAAPALTADASVGQGSKSAQGDDDVMALSGVMGGMAALGLGSVGADVQKKATAAEGEFGAFETADAWGD